MAAPIKMALTSEQRTKRLLEAGYFPAELPPPFTTVRFAEKAQDLLAAYGDKGSKYWTKPEAFNIPRWGRMRRKLSIVNPISQLYVANIIGANWDQIVEVLAKSRASEFHPELVLRGGRALTGVNFDGVQRRRAELLCNYGRYVKTDIARFYASIYTHSILWAIKGKGWTKQNFKKPECQAHFGNLLDKAIAAGQDGQTIGIPIGPDTSRLVSELIACAIEDRIRLELKDFDDRCVRYVDDMLIGLSDHETPDSMLSALSTALAEFQLELNGEKTALFGVGMPHSPEWLHFVKNFRVSERPEGQRDDLDSFFEHAFHLAEMNPRENVIRYAVRRATSFRVLPENLDHFVRNLMYAVRRSASCLAIVVEYTASLFVHGEKIPVAEIGRFIHQLIVAKADAAHTYEVAWLLFWARELGIVLDGTALIKVCKLQSSVLALLVMDLLQKGLISGGVTDEYWKGFRNADGLKSEMWLAAYELTMKGWWLRGRSKSFVESHELFGALTNAQITFYEPSRKARPRMGSEFLDMLNKYSLKLDDDEDDLDFFGLY